MSCIELTLASSAKCEKEKVAALRAVALKLGCSRSRKKTMTDDGFPWPAAPTPRGQSIRSPTLEIYAATHGSVLALRERRLTPDEIALATPVFGGSIWYDRVRIVAGLVVNAPTTLGNHIRAGLEEYARGLPGWVLIHELTHVWQFQTRGTGYLSDSLYHQTRAMIL